MILAIFKKELHEHWLVAIGFMAVAGLGLIVAVNHAEAQSGPIHAFGIFVRAFGVLMPLVLGQRLVVAEYHASTQLFVEALPLNHLTFVLVKLVFGGLVLTFIFGGLLAVLLMLIADQEPITVRFAFMLLARSAGYVGLMYSFFFAVGFAGRARWPIYMGLAGAIFAIEYNTKIEIFQTGPFSLVGPRFTFERQEWPLDALVLTAALITIMLLLAVLLSTLRDGELASSLSGRLSLREKVLLATITIGTVFALIVIDGRSEKEPYELKKALVEVGRGVTVRLRPGTRFSADRGRNIAQQVQAELAELRAYLGLTRSPPVSIVTRLDLDGRRFEHGNLKSKDGILIRINYASPDWDSSRFLVEVIDAFLNAATRGRTRLEKKRWVSSGFPYFWLTRKGRPGTEATINKLKLRALYAARQGVSPTDLERWLSFEDRVGTEIAGGVAWSLLRTIEKLRGPQAVKSLIRECIRDDLPNDARVLLHEHSHSMQSILHESADLTLSTLLDAWKNELDQFGDDFTQIIEAQPVLQANLELTDRGEMLRGVTVSARVLTGTTSEAPSLMNKPIGIFEDEIPSWKLRRLSHLGSEAPRWTLQRPLRRGQRLLWTVALFSPQMGCEVVSGWRREVIR